MAQIIDLKVGFSCNNHCIHCVASNNAGEKDLSLEEIEKLIDSYIAQYKTIQLTVTGGEVTIRKDFFQLMELIDRKKHEGKIEFVDMQTNARMLSDYDRALAAAKTMDFFLIAVHSCIPEVHDSITRVKGSFEQTITAISNLKRLIGTDKIAIQTVINKLNIDHLPDIYRFIYEDLRLSECNITFPHPMGICFSDTIVPTYLYSKKSVNLALQYCLSHKMNPYIEAIPFCVWDSGQNRDYVFEFMKKMETNVVGYAGEKDGHIDYGLLSEDGHRKYPSCLQCPYNSICEGVWKEYQMIYPNDDLFGLFLNS